MEFERLRGKATRLVQSIDDTAAVKGCHFLVAVQEFVMLEGQSISVPCPMSDVQSTFTTISIHISIYYILIMKAHR